MLKFKKTNLKKFLKKKHDIKIDKITNIKYYLDLYKVLNIKTGKVVDKILNIRANKNIDKIFSIKDNASVIKLLDIDYLMAGILFFVFLFMMILNSYSPLVIDDMVRMFSKNMIKIKGIRDIIANEKYIYTNINPHQIGNFISSVLLLINERLADFINSTVFSIFIYKLSSYGFANKRKRVDDHIFNTCIVILVFLLMWVSMPRFGNTFLMVSSMAKYVWIGIICIYVLINARKMLISKKEEDQTISNRKMLLIILASFLAGWSQENLAIAEILVLIFYICKSYMEKKKDTLIVLILSLVSMLTGFIVMISSPSRNLGVKMGFVDNDLLSYFIFFMIAAILLLMISRFIFIEKNWEGEIYFFAGIVSFFFIYLLPAGDKNPVFVPIMFFVISSLNSFSVIREETFKLSSTCLVIGLILYLILFLLSVPGVFSANKDYLSKYSAREIIIVDNRTNGNYENIEIPPIKAKNSHMAAYGCPDGSKDPKYWVNQYLSKYYGVGSVLVR